MRQRGIAGEVFGWTGLIRKVSEGKVVRIFWCLLDADPLADIGTTRPVGWEW